MEVKSSKGSLSDISAARIQKQPGNSALGVGLEARGVHAWFGEKALDGEPPARRVGVPERGYGLELADLRCQRGEDAGRVFVVRENAVGQLVGARMLGGDGGDALQRIQRAEQIAQRSRGRLNKWEIFFIIFVRFLDR